MGAAWARPPQGLVATWCVEREAFGQHRRAYAHDAINGVATTWVTFRPSGEMGPPEHGPINGAPTRYGREEPTGNSVAPDMAMWGDIPAFGGDGRCSSMGP